MIPEFRRSPAADPLLELYERVLAEGRELGVSPEVLMDITAEAHAFLFGKRHPHPLSNAAATAG